MPIPLGAFLRVAVRPVPRWAGLVSVLGPVLLTATAVWVWVKANPLVAVIVVLATMVALLFAAGIRLQGRVHELERQIQERESHERFIESLGYQLTFGEIVSDQIRWTAQEYSEAFQEMAGSEEFDKERLKQILNKGFDYQEEWEQSVTNTLRRRLGYAYESRFKSASGLAPAPPPPGVVGTPLEDTWKEHDMELQRLHEIIKELESKGPGP